MVAFGHSAVGVITGLGVYNLTQSSNLPLDLSLSFSAGLVSHYITDFIPHGHFFKYKDYHQKIIYVIIFDFLLSLVIFTTLAFSKFDLTPPFWFILFAIAGAQLPDILDGSVHAGFIKAKGILKAEYNFHMNTHWHGKLKKGLMLGRRDIWQLAVIFIAIILLITSKP